MLDGNYDREGNRILSEALNSALPELETKTERRLGKVEKAYFANHVTFHLLDAFDMGEHSPDGLKRVARSAMEQADHATIVGRP